MVRSAGADGLESDDRLKGSSPAPSDCRAGLDMIRSSWSKKEARVEEPLLLLGLQGGFSECIEGVGGGGE